ncbi:MAG: efflux RND transporter periplasmic adaptor subunit [Pseudomonadota bacterium]
MDGSEFSREKRPTALRGLLFFILLMVIGTVIVSFVLTMRSDAGPLVITEAPDPIPVETGIVELGQTLDLDESFSGLVQARQTSQLGFSVTGRIDAISADTGEVVRKGQTLVRLDTRALQARLAAAEAATAEAEAMQKLAEATLTRQTELVNRGHLSAQALDEAQAQADAAVARIAASEAQADTLRVDIDLARIKAPFDGTVTRRFMDVGATAAPGAPVLELIETGSLEARIGLPVSTAETLIPGSSYILDSAQGEVLATLRNAADIVDTRQRTITAIFDLDPTAGLPSGTVIRFTADREVSERGFWVPVSALQEADRGLWSILIVEDRDGVTRAAIRPVELIHTDGNRAYVRGAVQNGERYVSDGLQRVIPGQAVRPSPGVKQLGQLNLPQ